MEVVFVIRGLVLRTVVELRAELSGKAVQATTCEGIALDERVGSGRSSLTFGCELPCLDERMRSANYEVGFAFRSFGDGLQADPLLSVVIELVLDDSQQPLIEFEEGLYLHLMLGVELLLLLDVIEVVLDLTLDH